MKTCIHFDDGSYDAGGYVHFVGRPADDERGIDKFYDHRDALGCQRRADDDRSGSQYKDDCRGPEHEHMSRRVKEGPIGAGRALV